jgi:hypothetical protein
MELTTLQIARRIADAVLAVAPYPLYRNTSEADVPTQAVLRTLRENGVWLHRVVQDADGVIDGEAPSEVLPEVEA